MSRTEYEHLRGMASMLEAALEENRQMRTLLAGYASGAAAAGSPEDVPDLDGGRFEMTPDGYFKVTPKQLQFFLSSIGPMKNEGRWRSRKEHLEEYRAKYGDVDDQSGGAEDQSGDVDGQSGGTEGQPGVAEGQPGVAEGQPGAQAGEAGAGGTKTTARGRNNKTLGPGQTTNNGARRDPHSELPKGVFRIEIDKDDPRLKDGSFSAIGYERYVRHIWVPGHFATRYYQVVKKTDPNTGKTIRAAAPPAVLPNSDYDVSVLAHFVTQRYLLDVPVYRACKLDRLSGTGAIHPNTIYSMMIKALPVIEPLYLAIISEVLGDRYFIIDETYMQMFLEAVQMFHDFVRKAYLWLALGTTRNLVFFYFNGGSRAADAIRGIFERYYKGGTAHSDSYPVYTKMEGLNRVACLLHIARDIQPLRGLPEVDGLLGPIDNLFELDKEHKVGRPDKDGHVWTEKDQQKYRAEYSGRELDALEDAADAIRSSGKFPSDSPVMRAAERIHSEMKAIRGIFDVGYTELTTNTIERMARYVAQYRDSSNMIGSEKGGEALAMWLTIGVSALQHGRNPEDYICQTYTRLQKLPKDMPMAEKMEFAKTLLPDVFAPEPYRHPGKMVTGKQERTALDKLGRKARAKEIKAGQASKAS